MRAGRRLTAVALAAGGALLALCGCAAVRDAFSPPPGEAPEVPPPARSVIDNVPFLPSEGDGCGPAALAMLLRFLGKEADPAELARETRTGGLQGVLITDLAKAAEKRGVPMEVERLNIRRLRARIAEGVPVILLADLGTWGLSVPHYLLVYGYTPHSVLAHSGKKPGTEISYDTLGRQWEKMSGLALVVRDAAR